jgi:hypothetical protein
MKFKELYMESIRKMNDEKMDTFIKDVWKGKVLTFKYNDGAVMEFGKKYDYVLVTSDRKFFHIPDNSLMKKENDKIIKKYNLKEIK